MVGSGSALGSIALIGYLTMNEVVRVNKTKEELKAIFMPVIVTLSIIFISTVIANIINVMG